MKNKWQRMSKCCLIGLLFGNLILMISEILMILGVIDDAVDEWILAGIIFLNLCGIFIIIFPARISHCRICQELLDVMEEKEQVDSLTREVLGNITHDLKTPLTAIKGYSQGILDGVVSDPDKFNKYITTIRNKSNDMSLLVDELSFFAKIYQKDIQYQWQDVEAVEYFTACVSDFSLDLEMKKISLVFRNEVNTKTKVRIDTEKMKRVVNNIIGNASKYIQRDIGLLLVRLKEDDKYVTVEIADNGIGIAKDELPKIFQRFYRTDSSRNSTTGGSGLGLSIAQKIVDDHHGRIWAESELGEGTRVFISIPKSDK